LPRGASRGILGDSQPGRRVLDRRRALAALAAVTAAAAIPVSRAQPRADKPPRIGVLCYGSQGNLKPRIEAFRRAMRDLGYDEPRGVRYEWRYANGQPDLVQPLARELGGLAPEVLVSGSPRVTEALAEAARDRPVVAAAEEIFGAPGDRPRPPANVTGIFANVLETLPR
jgi:putative ABC transport system substrate-binding protein